MKGGGETAERGKRVVMLVNTFVVDGRGDGTLAHAID